LMIAYRKRYEVEAKKLLESERKVENLSV
jgi:hypothetical protein